MASAAVPKDSRSGQSPLADEFLDVYYELGNTEAHRATWKNTWWMGVPLQKCPLDLWLYQEILFADRPSKIIECGTAFGGSALYLANLCDLLGRGEIITVDIDSWDFEVPGYRGRPSHDRITYVKGSSIDAATIARVRNLLDPDDDVMVILDSDHTKAHVLEELRLYSPLVTPGLMLVVEDTMLNGHPVHADFGPGPMEALEEFLPEHPEFSLDPIGQKFLVSFNPRGYLRRAPAVPS